MIPIDYLVILSVSKVFFYLIVKYLKIDYFCGTQQLNYKKWQNLLTIHLY